MVFNFQLLVYCVEFLSQWTVISHICHLSLLYLSIILLTCNDTFSSGYLSDIIACLHLQFYPIIISDILGIFAMQKEDINATISLNTLSCFSTISLHIATLSHNFTQSPIVYWLVFYDCVQIPDKNQLETKWFILTYSSEVCCPPWQGSHGSRCGLILALTGHKAEVV